MGVVTCQRLTVHSAPGSGSVISQGLLPVAAGPPECRWLIHYVISATHSRSGAGGVKSRPPKSRARPAAGSGIVVRLTLPRTAPARPNSRFSRSTVHLATWPPACPPGSTPATTVDPVVRPVQRSTDSHPDAMVADHEPAEAEDLGAYLGRTSDAGRLGFPTRHPMPPAHHTSPRIPAGDRDADTKGLAVRSP